MLWIWFATALCLRVIPSASALPSVFVHPSSVCSTSPGLNSSAASLSVPPIGSHALSIPKGTPFASIVLPTDTMGSSSIPKVSRRPLIKGQIVVTIKAVCHKLPLNVPPVPIDDVSFH
ncbi:hypothetical protein E5676_scaffold447G00100 [Cucumis melo var. makuwa]|uniref:Secreted protein n=1 Tax=Cucumis melo var. makuwa TaxID=1194695 RepID=A0A5A7SKR9_CUCMM|nr:hypothetical protein E6C27_scaffold34G001020 [Cucumis melo var. makuwa]TYK09617.1 hypothetical protein E5676_scaffold447G00100 [Cucumis melo var. makuwa]